MTSETSHNTTIKPASIWDHFGSRLALLAILYALGAFLFDVAFYNYKDAFLQIVMPIPTGFAAAMTMFFAMASQWLC